MADLTYTQRILTHYITLLMQNQGLNVDSDTYAEIAVAVDTIAAEFKHIEQRLDAIEATLERARPIFGGAPVYTPDEMNVDTDDEGYVVSSAPQAKRLDTSTGTYTPEDFVDVGEPDTHEVM